jgi:hypothetical protein
MPSLAFERFSKRFNVLGAIWISRTCPRTIEDLPSVTDVPLRRTNLRKVQQSRGGG